MFPRVSFIHMMEKSHTQSRISERLPAAIFQTRTYDSAHHTHYSARVPLRSRVAGVPSYNPPPPTLLSPPPTATTTKP